MKIDSHDIPPHSPAAPEHIPATTPTDDETIDLVAARILKKYKPAFLELAK